MTDDTSNDAVRQSPAPTPVRIEFAEAFADGEVTFRPRFITHARHRSPSVSITFGEWVAMGRPESLTVTIEVG